MIKNLCLNAYFLCGLLLKLVLIVCIFSPAIENWYHPFIIESISKINLDPWKVWLEPGGSKEAFPYGYAMWIFFVPFILICKILGFSTIAGYHLTILAADFLLLFVLLKLVPKREKLLLFSYWLSPIVILATYGFGYNDIIPVLFLVSSVLFIKKLNFYTAGILLAAAVSAKLSMIIAVPLFLIYIFNNKSIRNKIIQFVSSFSITSLIITLPFIMSKSGSVMLFENPEISKIYNLALNIGDISIIIIPLLYFISLYFVWRFKRPNFDLFISIIGIAFLFIVLINPASPGWFVWSIPFLALYQSKSGRTAVILSLIYSVLYMISSLLSKSLIFTNDFTINLSSYFNNSFFFNSITLSLIHTLIIGFGIMLAVRMCREAISLNNFYRLTRNPFVLGVAGDSGSGKDTYLDAIEDIFGKHSVVKVSGDDYHLWDRGKPIWKNMTHLNPMANDLESFSNDLISLIDGKSISTRHYNHDTGKMSKKFQLETNDIIIAGGLHAFYLPILRDCYNLKIFLDMDEGLRRHFKIKRDVNVRGHSLENVINSFKRRSNDSKKFIAPQSKHADLIFSLQPVAIDYNAKDELKDLTKFKLVVTTKHGFNEYSLRRVLVGLCGLHVDIIEDSVKDETIMMIEGEISSHEIAIAAEILCPNIIEFLDTSPEWQNDMMGIMQLITLTHINQALSRKFI